ncbi:SDR family oxidoreductase [Burkholderia sp. Ac-20379]|uniref:SDR family oxidoreductase n=1 Tax=Burkholderia sp. Ac-20379 TaxID=2703900 RepID=UPI0019819A2F|nr:SDR family oxidoreductase [Burkholderia sp. Ac-20379]
MQKLEGKTALVTGGNSGIGLAIARKLAEAGAHVFIAGRRQAQLDQACEQIGGRVAAVQGDVTRTEDLDRLFGAIEAQAGGLDILVTSSGVAGQAALEATTEAHFDEVFDLNVRGMFFTVQRAVPLMRDGGSIVLVGSIAGSVGNAGFGTYSASKAAVRSYARTWAKELAGRGIRMNTLSPGPIDTPMMAAAGDEVTRMLTGMIPMGRIGRPDEAAAAALFLAGGDSSFVSGAELIVDGGMIA